MARFSCRLRFGFGSRKVIYCLLAGVVAFWVCSSLAQAQEDSGIPPQGLPNIKAGLGSFAIDFAEIFLDQQNKQAKKNEEQRLRDKELVESGAVSALDLDAPNNAIEEYNRASTLMKAQKSGEALPHFQKAIKHYPKFVSAYIGLGLAYIDQDDKGHAKDEFEAAAKLDDKFPGSFLKLGRLAISLNDFAAAESDLEKAASLAPKDARILSALVYAQNGDHQYPQALETAQRLHALEHKGMANVHYIAAASAMALNNFEAMQRELSFFLSEDPANPFAPVARRSLDALERKKNLIAQTTATSGLQQAAMVSDSQPAHTFPNSDRLKAQLAAVSDEPESGICETCKTLAEANATANEGNRGAAPKTSSTMPVYGGRPWTIHKVVDEVALFFAVSNHGQMVSDLDPSNIQIRDDNKPPEKVLQFTPQSKLPLRLGLLVDTSGSVKDRFSFEKHAATKFVEKVLNSSSDLAFVAGFASGIDVTQDFTADPEQLGGGIEKLTNGGGTALFDAVSFACWKLAAYPETERVARVLVLVSDGEDNSSHMSLKQAIHDAATTGVTIYVLSTSENGGPKIDADKILQVLAESSGGEAMFPADMQNLGKNFDKLRDLIRSRYLVTYKAADFVPNGKYRTVHIIAERNGKRFQVHARKGYYARLEGSNN